MTATAGDYGPTAPHYGNGPARVPSARPRAAAWDERRTRLGASGDGHFTTGQEFVTFLNPGADGRMQHLASRRRLHKTERMKAAIEADQRFTGMHRAHHPLELRLDAVELPSQCYSSLNTTTGSVNAARRTGRATAAPAVTIIARVAPVKVSGS